MEFTTYRLRDICEVKSGKRLPDGGEFSNEITSYPYIRARDIKNGIINKNSLCYISHDVYERIKRYIINQGDIAITIVANIGDVGYCEKELDGANLTENAVRLTNFKKGINTRYLTYYLSQPFLKSYMEGLAAGAAQAKLGIYKVNKIKVTIPSIKVQDTINSVISNYDQLIENNNKRIKLLEQMAEELYKEWFVRFRFPKHMKAKIENGIPEGWSIKKIKEVVKRLPFGQTYKGSELSESGEVIVIDQSTEEYLGFHNGEASHKASFGEPLLLFGDHTCKYQLMCKDFSLGENIIPYRNVDSSIDRYFLFYATKDIIKTEEYKRHWGRFVNFKILIPPIELQKEYREIVIRFEKEKNLLWDQNQNLIKQRDSLLPRLMSGKLSVEGKEIV